MSAKNQAIRDEIEKTTSFRDGQGNIIKRAGPGFETSADGAIVDDRNVMNFFMHRWLPRLNTMKTRTQVLRQIQDFQEKIPSIDMGILPDGTILPLPANHLIDEQRIHAEIIKVLKNFPGQKTDVTEDPGNQVMSVPMVLDAPISVLEGALKECYEIILEAHTNEKTPLEDLPEKLVKNLLQCQKLATRVIQRLDLLVNSPMFTSSRPNNQIKEATRVLNLYGPTNLPEKAKVWAGYFKARQEHEWAQMKKVAEEEEVQHEKEWAEMEKEAALQAEQAESDDEEAQKVQGFKSQMNKWKDHDFRERIRNPGKMRGAVKTFDGGRKTRKRKRKRRRKTRKRRKKKKTRKRKHKKRHRRTKRR